jgi:hypothetical protein
MAIDRKKLKEYLKNHTNVEAGKKFGVSSGYVSQLKSKIKAEELNVETSLSQAGKETVVVKRKDEGRRKRVPLGVPRMKLTAHNIPEGKQARWINDKPGRLDNALRGSYNFLNKDGIVIGTGYEDENKDMGSRVSRVVGKEDDGTPITAYLMVIDKDIYEADQAEKMKEIDKVDIAIRKGEFLKNTGDGRYVPKEGINIRES